MINKAIRLHQEGKLDEAEQIYKSLLDKEPLNADAISLVGLIKYQKKELLQARKIIECALAIEEKSEYLSNLILVYLDLGEYQEALRASNRALEINPFNAEAMHNKSLVLMKISEYAEVIELEQKAISIKNNFIEALNNLGIAYSKVNNYKKSIENYEKVLNINPNNIEALSNLAVINLKNKKYSNAIEIFKKILNINPNIAQVHSNISIMYYELKKYQEAVNYAGNSIKLNQHLAPAHCNKAKALIKLGLYKEAAESFINVLKINPEYPKIRGNLMHLKMQMCDYSTYEMEKKIITGEIEKNKNTSSAFAALAFLDDPMVQYKNSKLQKKINILKKNENHLELKYNKENKNGKIKIGYFSSDFKSHPVTYLIIGLLENHNKEKFEIYCFYSGEENDNYTKRVINNCFKFIDISKKSDEEVKKITDEVKLDIAVDLNGWTEDLRENLFELRMAPIQINMLGYPGTMGSECYEYIVADKYLIPDDLKKYYSEKKIYLRVFQPSDYKRAMQSNVNKKNIEGKFKFGVFNNNYKITPQMIELWVEILRRNLDTTITFISSNEEVKDNLLQNFSSKLIDSERIDFLPRMNYDEYLASYNNIHLFLDTYPFNGGTTANDSLWMDVPILTLSGNTYASRMAGSLLNCMNLNDLICKDETEYIEKAVRISKDLNKYGVILEKIRRNKETSVLFNGVSYAKNIEEAYSKINEILNAKKEIVDIDVSGK